MQSKYVRDQINQIQSLQIVQKYQIIEQLLQRFVLLLIIMERKQEISKQAVAESKPNHSCLAQPRMKSEKSPLLANAPSSQYTQPSTQKSDSQVNQQDAQFPQEISSKTFGQWLKKKAIQKIQKYTMSVILLPNTIEGLVKQIFKHYYGYELQFILVGVLVSVLNFLLVSYFLYKWFVKGEGGVKTIVKQKLKQIDSTMSEVRNYFVPGNEGNLLKVYFITVFAGFLANILPDPVFTGGIGLSLDLYKEIKSFLFKKYSKQIQYVQEESYKQVLILLSSLPKYKSCEEEVKVKEN